MDKAVAYLKKSQDPAGSWSGDRSPGVTGIVLTGLLKCGRVTSDDEVAARALKYIESLVNEKAGHIAGGDPKPQLLNYVTSVNVMALEAANRADKYKAVIGNAAAYLKKLSDLEAYGKEKLQPKKGEKRRLIAFHDSLYYFTRTFGLSPSLSTLPGSLPFVVNSSIGPLVTNDRPAFSFSIQPP